MAWIESHTVIGRHRKLRELAIALRLRPAYVAGHLHLLWHAALEQQEDGDLSSWTDEFIADQADFPGDAPQFVRLLHCYGFLNGRLICNWIELAGSSLSISLKNNRPRREYIWSLHGRTLNPQRTVRDFHSAFWKKIRSLVFKRDNFTCKYCGKFGGNLEADHVIPYSSGGETTEFNLVTSCRKCNRRKGDLSVSEFMSRRMN